MAYAVGLTGGIASGKSAVARCFVDLGVDVVDADHIAREVVEPGSPGLAQLVAHFGADILKDGALDRAHMRQRVFADPAQRTELERILHPLIRARLLDRREEFRGAYGVLMVPLLVKFNLGKALDRLLVVDADVEVQRHRLIERDRIAPALADQMLAAQEDRASRLAAANDVLLNHGTAAELPPLVQHLHDGYLRLARGEIADWPPQHLP